MNGIVRVWRDWKEERTLRTKLTDCFHAAGLYLAYKSDKYERFIYPKIHSVKADDSRIQFVFTLPNGMDPKEVTKKEYAFYQFFGRNIEIKTDYIKKYTLNVYAKSFTKEITWKWEEVASAIDDMSLPIYCGQDVRGRHVAYDMIQQPHLLIAGETGSGKSTQVRSVLTTLIKRMDSERLHLYLADMKRSEFHLFRRVKHVKSVCTRVTELSAVLAKLQTEMKRRGDLLDKYEVMHVDDLHEKLPYIVLCVDEVALLKKEKDVMQALEEISSIGRALGVFLILSMQRPDAQVLDGKLKINLTVRMGFRCADATNSRIVGTPGAEDIDITERGRMILKLEKLREVQAPYLDAEKAKELLEPYKVAKEKTQEQAQEGGDVADESSESIENKKIFGVLNE